MAEPAMAPDLKLYQDDVPETFPLVIRREGVAVDLSDSVMTATISDNDVTIGQAQIDASAAADGRVLITVPAGIYSLMKRYATLRFHEATVFQSLLMTRRLVKI